MGGQLASQRTPGGGGGPGGQEPHAPAAHPVNGGAWPRCAETSPQDQEEAGTRPSGAAEQAEVPSWVY